MAVHSLVALSLVLAAAILADSIVLVSGSYADELNRAVRNLKKSRGNEFILKTFDLVGRVESCKCSNTFTRNTHVEAASATLADHLAPLIKPLDGPEQVRDLFRRTYEQKLVEPCKKIIRVIETEGNWFTRTHRIGYPIISYETESMSTFCVNVSSPNESSKIYNEFRKIIKARKVSNRY